MNAIQYALNEVRHSIPPQVLKLVFDAKRISGAVYFGNEPQLPTALEAEIRGKVIDSRVMPMINCIGATQVEIPLHMLPAETIDRSKYLYRIPKEYTQGRSIVSVSGLTYGTTATWLGHGTTAPTPLGTTGCGVSALTNVQQQIISAVSPIPIVQTANVTLIGENVVLVEDFTPLPTGFFLRCNLSHDEELSRINPSTYPDFAEMVTYAVKAYIYNNFYIELGAGALVAGIQLGQIKDIVDSYADAGELLTTYFKERWRKISFVNDDGRYRRAVRSTLGSLV